MRAPIRKSLSAGGGGAWREGGLWERAGGPGLRDWEGVSAGALERAGSASYLGVQGKMRPRAPGERGKVKVGGVAFGDKGVQEGLSKKAQWGFPCQGKQLIRGLEARSLAGLAGRGSELRSSACG